MLRATSAKAELTLNFGGYMTLEDRVEEIYKDIKGCIYGWKGYAESGGISEEEIERCKKHVSKLMDRMFCLLEIKIEEDLNESK